MENKKSEMSVEYNMDEMKKSLKNLKETECYDVEKYTYSLLHQTRQLEYPSLEVITIFFRTTFKPFLSICRFYRLFLYF